MKTGRLLLIGFVLLVVAGRFVPMTLMLEPGDPEILFYTSIWFLASTFLMYPSRMVVSALGFQMEHMAALLLDLVWVTALATIIYFVPLPSVREGKRGRFRR